MAKLRIDYLGDREDHSHINVNDIQIIFDALIDKGNYRPQIHLTKYQDSFFKDGEIYTAARGKVPYILTGNWAVDSSHVRPYATVDHSASVAIAYASDAGASASEALASENKAQEWAEKAPTEPVEPGKYSAKHWAKEAEESVLGTGYVRKNKNLSDLPNAATARHNLGLGNAATKSVGGNANDVAAGDHIHAVVSPADNGFMSVAEHEKLADIAAEATKNAPDIYLLNRQNHTGQQNISTVSGLEGALANKVDKQTGMGLSQESYTTAEKNKLSGIAEGATANATNDYLLNRENHTGTQEMETVDGLADALATKSDTGHNHDSSYQKKFVSPPATSSSSGAVGDIAVDTGFIYVCTAANAWKRVAIEIW